MEAQKTITEKNDDAILKLFYLALKIQRHTDKCVFFSIHGHVETMDLKISNSKNNYSYMPVKSDFEIAVKSKEYKYNSDSEDRLERIFEIIEFYENTLKENNINYDILYPIKEITSYEL